MDVQRQCLTKGKIEDSCTKVAVKCYGVTFQHPPTDDKYINYMEIQKELYYRMYSFNSIPELSVYLYLSEFVFSYFRFA